MILKVIGPLEVPYSSEGGGRDITPAHEQQFWELHGKHASRNGCYVFAMRAGKGSTPGYVGKTKRGFKREVFGSHQKNQYFRFMSWYRRGRPVFFFVMAPRGKGKPNDSLIRQVEKYLIDLAWDANPYLLNQKGKKRPRWGIQGVIRGQQGKTTAGTAAFRTMLNL